MQSWKDKLLGSSDDKQKLLRFGGSYFILFLAMGSMVIFGILGPNNGGGWNSVLTGSAAKVGSESISDLEFRRAYNQAFERYRSQFGGAFEPRYFQLSKTILGQLVDNRVMAAIGADLGLVVSDTELDRMLTDAAAFRDEQGKFSGEQFERFLRQSLYTEATFTAELKRGLLGDKVRRLFSEGALAGAEAIRWSHLLSESKFELDFVKLDPKLLSYEVPAEELKSFQTDQAAKIKEYYDNHADDYRRSEKVRASHILISFKGTKSKPTERSKEEAFKLAQSLSTRAKAEGADFAALAKAESDDAVSKEKGGDLGEFNAKAMVKEFSDKAFQMNVGEVSEAIESPFGYHVIKLFDKIAARTESLEEASPNIAKTLIETEARPKVAEEAAKKLIALLQEQKDPEAEQLLKEKGLKWDATGSFSLDQTQIPSLGSEALFKEALWRLPKVGAIHPEPLKLGTTQYVLRLKAKKLADPGSLDEAKRDEIGERLSRSEGSSTAERVRKEFKDTLQSKGRIWLNPEFENFDSRSGPSAGEEEG